MVTDNIDSMVLVMGILRKDVLFALLAMQEWKKVFMFAIK